MSEEEFLARWSRRKSEARSNVALPQATEAGDPSAGPPPSAAKESVAKEKDEPEFDPSSLPPIDAITAATDITAYLRKGIPQELTRAALRRAWTADPVIRDFVGLAENAWDFNDPTAMPGFGPLDCSETELAEWVDRIVGGVRDVAESLLDTSLDPGDSEIRAPELHPTETTIAAEVCDQSPAVRGASALVAVQPLAAELEINPACVRCQVHGRVHGGALPK
jgi:hypothetical protein